MKYLTTAQWAQTRDMSMGDLEECLMELGYQVLDTEGELMWRLTPKGRQHAKISWNIFNRSIRWDIDAFFDAVKHYGRKTRRYFYCTECGDYMNNQNGFDTTMDKWVCKKCGHVNELAYAFHNANKLAEKCKNVLGSPAPEQQPKAADVHWKCPECGREAYGIDEISVIVGFVKIEDGKLVPHTECKACRKKQ